MKQTLFVFFLCLCYFIELPFGTAQLHVEGLLHVQGDALVFVEPDINIATTDGIVENNGTIVAEGNVIKESTASYLTTSTQGERTFILSGDSPTQRITGDFIGTQSFYELTLDKAIGMVELNSNIEVSQSFNLVQGKLRTDSDSGTQASDYQYELFLNNPTPSALTGNFTVANSSNFVEGRLRRSVMGTGTYNFPVGLTENNPFSVTFNQAAELSDITASLEAGTSTPLGMNFSCPTTTTNTVDCAVGRWNIQGTAANYDYDIAFSPSPALLENCPGTNAFFVSRNASFDCDLDDNISDGISSSFTGGFGLFDLPAAMSSSVGNTDCQTPMPTVIPQGNGRVNIEWDPVPGAESYFLQVRIQGMNTWLINFRTQSTKVFVTAPTRLELEYRLQTSCEGGGESEFTEVFEFNTRPGGNLASASSRNADKIDIDLSNYLSEATVFPNPISNQLQITYAPISDDATLLIHHANGQLIHQSTLAKEQSLHTIDANEWNGGLYILSIKEKGQALVSKKITKIAVR